MALSHHIKQFFGFEAVESDTQPAPPLVDTRQKRHTSMTICIEAPHIYEDSLSIGNHLRDGNPIIISLKHLSADSGKRLIDFLSGTTYAIDGTMAKIGEGIFLFAPPGVMLSGNDNKGTHSDKLLHTLNNTDA